MNSNKTASIIFSFYCIKNNRVAYLDMIFKCFNILLVFIVCSMLYRTNYESVVISLHEAKCEESRVGIRNLFGTIRYLKIGCFVWYFYMFLYNLSGNYVFR